jgi:hypothetical protein
MKAQFTTLVQKFIAEQGIDAMFDAAKCKSFLARNSTGAAGPERQLLLRVVESGVTAAIAGTADLASCKQSQAQLLQNSYNIAPKVANGAIDILAPLLRGTSVQKTVPAPQSPQYVPPPQYNPPPPDNRKFRHGFTTFFLWFSLLCAGLQGLSPELLDIFGILDQYTSAQIWTERIGGFAAVGLFLLLLEWSKFGFYGLVIVSIIFGIIDPYGIGHMPMFIGHGIYLAILYGVLHFHNAYNGKTTWEQLS